LSPGRLRGKRKRGGVGAGGAGKKLLGPDLVLPRPSCIAFASAFEPAPKRYRIKNSVRRSEAPQEGTDVVDNPNRSARKCFVDHNRNAHHKFARNAHRKRFNRLGIGNAVAGRCAWTGAGGGAGARNSPRCLGGVVLGARVRPIGAYRKSTGAGIPSRFRTDHFRLFRRTSGRARICRLASRRRNAAERAIDPRGRAGRSDDRWNHQGCPFAPGIRDGIVFRRLHHHTRPGRWAGCAGTSIGR